jgi:hypothetical protein
MANSTTITDYLPLITMIRDVQQGLAWQRKLAELPATIWYFLKYQTIQLVTVFVLRYSRHHPRIKRVQ